MRIWILLFFCLNAIVVMSQEENTKNAFDLAVDALKEGGLVVLLPTRSKSIEAMEELLINGQLSQRGRHDLEERLLNTRFTVKRDQQWMGSFFKKYYTASAVYFYL